MSCFSRKKRPSTNKLSQPSEVLAQLQNKEDSRDNCLPPVSGSAVRGRPRGARPNGPGHIQPPPTGPSLQSQLHQKPLQRPQPQSQPALGQQAPQESQQQPQQQYPWSSRPLVLSAPIVKAGNVPPNASWSSPFMRSGYALSAPATANGDIYLFGGIIEDVARNDLYLFSMRDLSVTLIDTAGDIPSPRVGHAAALVSSALIIWGGNAWEGDAKTDGQVRPGEKHWQDDGLYLLNLVTREWTKVVTVGPSPLGRFGHTMCTVGTKFYIFGGQTDGGYFNDVWSFDLNILRTQAVWEHYQVTPNSRVPAPRSHRVCVTYGDKIIMFGGTDGSYHYNDTWSFDTDTKTWAELNCIGFIPLPRAGHAASIVDDVMYVFGGRGVDRKDLGDLAAFKITSQSTAKTYVPEIHVHQPGA